MEKVQRAAIGVAIIATIEEDDVVVDVSSVTTKQLVFKKPNGVVVTKTAAFVTDGINGKIQYITESGFLDVVGTWSVQGYVVFPAGFDGRSDIVRFSVKENL